MKMFLLTISLAITLSGTVMAESLETTIDKINNINNSSNESCEKADCEGYEINDKSLWDAIKKNNLKAVKCLISNGISAKKKGADGETPLMVAARNNYIEIVVYLVENKQCDLNAKTKFLERTALIYAIDWGHNDLARYLIRQGSNVKQLAAANWTPLLVATLQDEINLRLVRTLIENGADVNAEGDVGGLTPLFGKFKNLDNHVAKLLIANGANVNHINKNGENALTHRLWYYDCIRFAELLLANGIDINKVSETYQTPLDLAIVRGRKKTEKFLRDNGAKTYRELYPQAN